MRKSLIPSFVIFLTILWVPTPVFGVPVTFHDAALLSAVKNHWEASTGLTLSDPPEDTQLANPLFTTLDARSLGITDLTGLEACTALTTLNLGLNQISDLSPLSALTGLKSLDVGFGTNPLEKDGDFDPSLTGTNLITDLAPLAGLVNLEYLSTMGNDGITSIAAIRTMDSLAQLWIASHPLTDFSPLNDVADTLQFLGEINCGLQPSDLAILNNLSHLQGLGILMEPAITDVSGLTAIDPSIVFALMMVPVTDISVVAGYTQVQMLQISMTNVTTIPDLSGLAHLQEAGFEENVLTDISGLAGLTSITRLNLQKNHLTDISALATCTGIMDLDLNNNQLTDIQPLLDNPSIANFRYINLQDNAFFAGSPFCEESQLDQLRALAPTTGLNVNAVCGAAANLTITVNGTGGTYPEPGVNIVLLNEYHYVNAYPVSGSGQAFGSWSGDLNSTNQNDSIYMDGDKSITANFVPGEWTLTLNKTGVSSGSTWPDPGVYSYLSGQSASVQFSTENGTNAYFGGWSGDASGYANQVSLVMDGNKTVSANFESSGFALYLNTQGGPGQINGFWNSGPFRYAAGANFTIEAQIWDNRYRFDHWEGDLGTGVNPYDAFLPIVMDMDRHITAVFIEDSKILTLIIEGPGHTNPEGGAAPGTQYSYGRNEFACIYALPDSTVAFDHWSGDIGNNYAYGSNLCVTMDQDRTITAHFNEADYSLTLQATGNGTTNPSPGVYGYVSGAQANFGIQLIEGGDAFDHWTGDLDEWQSDESTWISTAMDRNRTLTANFVPGDWTLTLSKSGAASGNVYPNPGTYAYLDGRSAGLSANSSPSAYFAGWTGDVVDDNPYIEVIMDGNKAVNADFADSGYSLTVTTNGQGWVNFGGPQYFANGMKPVVNANATNGFTFAYWTGDVPDGVDPASPSIPVLMDRDRALTANFILTQKHLTLVLEGEGVTSPLSAAEPGLRYDYNEGQQITLSAEAGVNGWAFSHWSGDIGSNDPNARAIFITMDTDRTIVANYVPADWTLTVAYTGNGGTWPNPGSYGFLDGTEIEVVANIFEGGDAFDHWEGLPEDVDGYDPGPRFPIHGNITATAIFGPGDFTLTTTVMGGGTAEYVSHPAGSYQYKAGHYAHLEVRPNESTYWGGYSGDLNTYETFYRLLMDGNKNVTINLATSGYTLTVNAVGGGTTNPSGAARFAAGAVPAIHALDVGAYLFTHWTGQLPAGADSTARDLEVLMDQNRTVTANFDEADWYLYLQVAGNGTIAPAPELYWYLEGASFEVTATPGPGALFLHWQGNIPEGQHPASLTISGTMTQNRELIAVFVPAFVTVPNLAGQTQAEAEAALSTTGLVVGEITQSYSSTVPAGRIISQDPSAGTSAAYGSPVSLVISLGVCYTSIPDLTGLDQAEAAAALASAHLSVGVITQEISEATPEGQIIHQTPLSGLVVECGTAVDMAVSLGNGEEGEGETEGGGSGAHTADQDGNNLISLSELLRVIQFFNSNGYHCEAGTEDGFAPGTGPQTCAAHDSDYTPQDWQIGLSELLRLIQFFNSGGYHACPEESTEDGFCPGLG